jgi:hypothetical protein
MLTGPRDPSIKSVQLITNVPLFSTIIYLRVFPLPIQTRGLFLHLLQELFRFLDICLQ